MYKNTTCLSNNIFSHDFDSRLLRYLNVIAKIFDCKLGFFSVSFFFFFFENASFCKFEIKEIVTKI